MGSSRNASIALAPGRSFTAPKARVSGPFTVRLASATLAGLAAAFLAAGSPVETFLGGLVLGSSLLLPGLAALTAGAVHHRRAARGSHRSHLTSGRIAERQGAAFLLWFVGHAAVWAGGLVLGAAAALRSFGPAGLVLVGVSGCAAAATFSLSGLAGSGPLSMLGLCWERRGPSPSTSRISPAETAVVLRSRFVEAFERDAATARESGRMSTFTRLQIALDLARAGRSGPRLHLQTRLRESAADEIFRRAPALGLAALPAMVLTLLLALSGLLGLPSAFDPRSWPSMASLSGKSEPGPEDGDAAAPAATGPSEAKDDEASIEPPEDSSRYDPPSPGEDATGQQEEGAPEDQDSEKGSSGDDGSASSGAESSETGTEARDGSEGTEGRQSSTSGEAAPDPRGNDPEGTEPAPSGEPSPDGGEGSASGGDSAPTPGETGDAEDGSAESPGDTPAPGQGAAGDGGRQASEAQAGQGGSGSGQDETEAKDAWGLGSGSPFGEATSLEPPAASDVITLHLPVLGSQTVRLEDEEVPPSAATDAPAGPRSRRRPGEPLEERAETEPSPPQQPLPAWIVRLLRKRAPDPQGGG